MNDVFGVFPKLPPLGSLFSLQVGGVPLRVVRLSGKEAISSLFEFHIEVAGGEFDPDVLLGHPATMRIHGLEEPRLVHGLVREAEYVGETSELQLYELKLAPWAHRLRHRSNCRVFQELTTQQIIAEVLRKAGLPATWFRFSLVGDYGPRNYCVQYRESDLAFIERLLEEDGIFYFFDHEADKHVWVMADHPQAHTPIAGAPTVWFNSTQGAQVQDYERVRNFRFGAQVRPGRVSLRDKNLHKPDQSMEVKASAQRDPELELYDFPGEFQHPGHGGPHQGQMMAKIRLEALQATRRLGVGDSDCPRLTPGKMMTLLGHPRAQLNEEYRILQVLHVGHQPQVLDQDAAGTSSYHNSFTVSELKVPFRPARTTPRPVVRGLQTATVVGPEGEEVHTDGHGRVRVQFHWDREGKHNADSTCWVRVSQIWAGNGYGALFLPRIGHEVLVDFLEGDPDRPIVTGRIYHGLNATPYPLPEDKTKSTIKSESSLGGGGFNELRFEDRKGEEEVFIHAQKDKVVHVRNDRTETVGRDEKITIGANRTEKVGANESITIGASRSESVGGDETITIARDRTKKVGLDEEITIGKDRTLTITANEKKTVGGDLTLSIAGVKRETTTLAASETIGLGKALSVGLGYQVSVGALKNETVGGAHMNEVGAYRYEKVAGNKTTHVGKRLTVRANQSMVLRAGASMLKMTRAGKITLTGTDITIKSGAGMIHIDASGIITIKGPMVKINT